MQNMVREMPFFCAPLPVLAITCVILELLSSWRAGMPSHFRALFGTTVSTILKKNNDERGRAIAWLIG